MDVDRITILPSPPPPHLYFFPTHNSSFNTSDSYQFEITGRLKPVSVPFSSLVLYIAVMSTLPLLAGDLRFFASSPALLLWYINLPLFTSTINIEYLVKNKADLV